MLEVEVKTGKVAVYAKVDSEGNPSDHESILLRTDERIIIPKPNFKAELTPNQRIIFNKGDRLVRKTIVNEPVPISEPTPYAFYYDNEPLANVFDALQKTYGIQVNYDKENL